MKTIPLTQGKVALVDDQDYHWLNQWKWHAHRTLRKSGDIWYAVRNDGPSHRRSKILMHREIAARAGLPQVDHQDCDGLHNWRDNLRPCDRHQNQGNRRKTPGCSSRFKGVTLDKTSAKWNARIGISYKVVYLGTFDDETEAAKAYDAAARAYFGEFALVNFSTM